MDQKIYKVYMHINKINNKKYIGITKQELCKRWGARQYKSCVAFNNAIEKYGWENFEHKTIAIGLTKEEAENMEKELIVKYNTRNKKYGYNISEGGNGNTGHKLTQEQKDYISIQTKKALSGKKPPNYGKHLSKETKEKISKNRKGKCCGKDNHNYGHPLSQETKEKMSISLKAHWSTHENPNKGKPKSKDAIQKMIESKKGKYLGVNNKMSKPVLQIDINSGEIIDEFAGVQEAARKTGAMATKISACCLGKRNHHHGYKWCHKQEYEKKKVA